MSAAQPLDADLDRLAEALTRLLRDWWLRHSAEATDHSAGCDHREDAAA
jgi:hypothetical protein